MNDDDEHALTEEQFASLKIGYDAISRAFNQVFYERDGEWAGIPMPLPGCELVVEPRYPRAKDVMAMQAIIDDDAEPTPEPPEDCTLINQWYSDRLRGTVVIARDHETGRRVWWVEPNASARNTFWLKVFVSMDAWDLERELRAMQLLQTLLSARMFKAYLLTGTFLETSPRSELVYLFRRMRPTVVLTPHNPDRQMTILCALCLHPIAFYAETFCGAMVPTDDVIAHLMLMRADEALFWRRANQHEPYEPEAGL